MVNQQNANQIGQRLWHILGSSLFLGFVIQRVVAARFRRQVKTEREDQTDNLAVHLNDHLAGSVAAIELLTTLEEKYAHIQPVLEALRADIEQDQAELKALMDRLNISESSARKIGGWITEKATQFKMRVDDHSAGALRLLEGLEALSLGIEGKLALWGALHVTADRFPRLKCADYERLIERALDQRKRAEALILDAAIMALRPKDAILR
jgi:hypothetical protein